MTTPELPAQYPPLPAQVDDAVVALQAYIDRWHTGLFPNGVEHIQSMVEETTVRAPAVVVEERAKLVALGLNPDVFLPLPVDHKPVTTLMSMMTFPEDSIRDWLVATGFVARDVETIVARLTFLPPEIVEYVDQLDDEVRVEEDRIVDVVAAPRRGPENPLLTPATAEVRPTPAERAEVRAEVRRDRPTR